MPKSRKRIAMAVTVSYPKWLTAAQARQEVRALINDQAFYGSRNEDWEEIDESNFRAVKVSASCPFTGGR